MNFPQAGELHRRVGRQAVGQASGLHIRAGRTGCTLSWPMEKGGPEGYPFLQPALFRNPPDRLFVQPAKSSRFSFGNTALQPSN